MYYNEVEIISVCKISEKDEKNNIWLYRLADIVDNKIVRFDYDENDKAIFNNRRRIYWRDGPAVENFIGVWNWTAKPNKNNDDMDYVESYYNKEKELIEIIIMPNCYSIDDLIELIKNGIELNVLASKLLFSYSFEVNKYEGILCSDKQIDKENGMIKLKDDVILLNKYTFDKEDIFFIDDSRLFFSYLDIENFINSESIYVKESYEIVRRIILKRASWNLMKPRGLYKNEWKHIKEFLEKVSEKNLYQEIADEYKCYEDEAKRYTEEFIGNAYKYLDPDSIDDIVMEQIVNNHPVLMEKCEKKVAENWRAEHQKALEDLHNIESEVDKQNKILHRLLSEIDIKQKEIIKYESLANEIEYKVSEKIKNAKENAADFISEMIFMISGNSNGNSYMNDTVGKYISGNSLIKEEYENSDWKEEIQSIEDILIQELDISEEYSFKFSAFLYVSHIHKMPLALAGLCGESIANAISASLFGKTAGILDCSNEYNADIVKEMIESKDEVIIIKAPFNSQWEYNLPELLMSGKKHFILTCPFVEDLLIEPRSWFNYVIPIITDFFVNKTPDNLLKGGWRSEKFVEYEGYNNEERKNIRNNIKSIRILEKLNMGNFIYNKVKDIIIDVNKMSGTTEDNINDLNNIIYLCIVFPYAYFTGQQNTLIEELNSANSNISKDLRKMILKYIGEEYGEE